MSEFRINTVLQASYRYDAMGRQAIRSLSSPTAVTIHSVFDSQGRRIAEYNQATGALIREYVWNGWEPVAVIEGGVVSFVRTDHIGRPVFATNSTGVKVWEVSYLPFGGVRVATGSPTSARFPGQWFQSESGLHQNWMRDYDPTTGRYLEPDPLGLVDGASVYGYVGQSPTMLVDPNGEKSLLLQHGGWLFDGDWSRDPSLPLKIGKRWNHACSSAQLVYHEPTKNDPNGHWHYYPNGEKSGGRNGAEDRWRDSKGADHFYPPYLIDVPECPCAETSAAEVVTGVAIVILLLLKIPPIVAAGGGAVATAP